MNGPPPRSFGLGQALLPFFVLAAVCVAIYGALWVIDFGVQGPGPFTLWTSLGAAETLTSFAEVVVGVLGIAITVVAIIVELAANRYTPRITEMFVRDPVNVVMMSSFAVTSVLVIWIDMSLYGPHHPAGMSLAAAALMTTSLLAILPYFAYVFDFLSPTRVVQRIQQAGSRHITRLARGSDSIDSSRRGLVRSVEQLGDIALNSVDKNDKPLTLEALEALARVAKDHIRHKPSMPEAWFDSRPLVRVDQDFIALHPDMVRALTARRTWLEMKVLRQYQAIFSEAVNRVRDVNHLIGIHTRHIALAALEADDRHALQLAMRFMNTYLRNAINSRDVRTSYNMLNEYRLLAERTLDAGEAEFVVVLANYIKFYGQLAFGMNLAFLLETAAFDLCALLEHAHGAKASCHDALLDIFLDVDREPEGGKSQETSLRGVRKAQIKLATYYLVANDEPGARRIFEDMRAEDPERLRSIRGELERVEEAEYWEVSDRGINFEWLEPARRAQLETFFGWFGPRP